MSSHQGHKKSTHHCPIDDGCKWDNKGNYCKDHHTHCPEHGLRHLKTEECPRCRERRKRSANGKDATGRERRTRQQRPRKQRSSDSVPRHVREDRATDEVKEEEEEEEEEAVIDKAELWLIEALAGEAINGDGAL
ncbi:MAG: hypothetical protein Q9210_006056 [Variospora velana]